MALRFGSAVLVRSGLLHRSNLPAARGVRTRLAFSTVGATAKGGDDAAVQEENKAKINAAWNSSAEAYVGNVQDGASSASLKVSSGMNVGYKLATRIVTSPYDKVQPKEPGKQVVLDVASAGGEPAITIAKAMPGATVHATDFAPAMMDLIRKRAAEEGVSNVVASVADGEALTGFGDGSVDAVTCTWGLLFMPNWQRAIQEFSRVLKRDGVVAVTLWERQEGSVFQRMRNVVETLVPGFQLLIDAEALGEDGGSAVVEEMKAAGLCDVSASKFSVPVVLSADARPRDIWEHYTESSPLGQTMSTLEKKGRTNVRQEAMDIFEDAMNKEWVEGRTPLGLQKEDDAVAGGSSPAASRPPRIYYVRALVVVGRKTGGG
ncbi:methyltransferase [Ectocarpus siliculosus]|uniref:Methyltransferase n=1 Tax=Ectocarpus siliculosus TaxID=2880 RepID=D8LCM6_ECTSI|nr:methyltransferase [Ectocarpus siliculosus]|eukprot:CBN79539.1 methyltransferase [Ectocarpus siliculosus]